MIVKEQKAEQKVDLLLDELSDPEVQEAMITLIRKLPAFAKYASAVEQAADFLVAVGNDKQSQQYVMEGLKGYIAPVAAQVQDGFSLIREAKERADRQHQTVSVFDLFKLLKDPAVQKALRFVQAFLEVLAEKSK